MNPQSRPRHVLVATTPEDIHATMVQIALRELGHKATLWMPGDLPETAVAGWSISDAATDVLSAGQGEDALALETADVFWFRRTMEVHIGREMHPADHAMAVNETRSFVRGLYALASDRCVAVNGYTQAMAAEIKPHQLRIARRIGMRIPETLVSNDPALIRDFIRRMGPGGTIYKPFNTAIWQSDGRMAFSYTSVVGENDLPSDNTLRLTPGIFQRRLDKAFEVRVTCMGRRLIAVRLDSQAVAGAALDWRSAQNSSLRPTAIALPPVVAEQCRRLLDALDLRFGCIDFVVTPEGEYVFLEINQMGQFLWIEEANPAIPMLDAFVAFILDPDAAPDTGTAQSTFGLSFHEFAEPARAELERLQGRHRLSRQTGFVYSE
jgi:glutathione synthase/RimK-type ligase-like ATP-grasp enzyme